MSKFIKEKEGQRYGYWRVIGFYGFDNRHNAMWLCKCEMCGNIYPVRGFTLRNGKSHHCRSCNGKD